MKKVITLSVTSVFCFVIAASAQINKGSLMLGGTFGGSFSNVKNPDTVATKVNTVSIQPALGFAVDTNTIVGFSLLYASGKNDYFSYQMESNSFGAGVFLRKYKPLGNSFYLFGEGGINYAHGNYNYSTYNNTGGEYDSKSDAVTLYLTPGVAYSLTRSLQIEAGLQNLLSVTYASADEKAVSQGYRDYKISEFGFNSNLNPVALTGIFVGVRFLFNQ